MSARRLEPALYAELLSKYQPRVIVNDEDYDASQLALNELLALHERTPEQDAMVELAAFLIEAWERENIDLPALPEDDLEDFIMEQTTGNPRFPEMMKAARDRKKLRRGAAAGRQP